MKIAGWFIVSLSLLGWVMVSPAVAGVDVQAMVVEADASCRDQGRKTKDDMYIAQALLAEKESCLIREFAKQLITAEEETITASTNDSIEACVRAAHDGKNVDLPKYQSCMVTAISELGKKVAVPCREIPRFMSIRVGQSTCEDTVLLLLSEKVKEIILPENYRWMAIYNKIADALKPIMPFLPMLALGVYLLYLADIFWQGVARYWQTGILTVLLLLSLVAHFLLGFILGLPLVIPVIVASLVHNRLPRRAKQKNFGMTLDEIDKMKNDYLKQSQ